MDVEDLSYDDIHVLVILAKHLVYADGVVSKDEYLDMMSLAEAVGQERFESAMTWAENRFQDPQEALKLCGMVQDLQKRRFMFLLLEELAKGDMVNIAEADFLAEVGLRWGMR